MSSISHQNIISKSPDDDLIKIREMIARIKCKKGLNQADIAKDYLCITPKTLSCKVSGKAYFNLLEVRTIQRLAGVRQGIFGVGDIKS